MEINYSDWFKKIMDITEQKWKQNPLLDKISDNMGHFETYTINELKQQIKNKYNNSKSKHIPEFIIVIR